MFVARRLSWSCSFGARSDRHTPPPHTPLCYLPSRICDAQIRDNVGVLVEAGLLQDGGSHIAVFQDLEAEAINRATLNESLEKDIVKLSTTLERVRRHHDYLQEQLEQYNTYLQNVRKNQGSAAEVAVGTSA